MSKVITAGVLIAAALVVLVVLTAPHNAAPMALGEAAPAATAPVITATAPTSDHITDLAYMPRIIAEDPGQRPYNP